MPHQARHHALAKYLQQRIPGCRLEHSKLPLVPEVSLYLINHDYPRDGLNREQAQALMDSPPYWGFCWASGQVLARFILDNPALVRGKTLVDLGAGSGVVAIAAKLAGAKRVIACDLDPIALQAAQLNAQSLGIDLEYRLALDDILTGSEDCADLAAMIVTVADVFYDRDNLPLLSTLQRHFGQTWVADSRLKDQALAGMSIIASYDSHTVPDLEESREFNQVTLYKS